MNIRLSFSLALIVDLNPPMRTSSPVQHINAIPPFVGPLQMFFLRGRGHDRRTAAHCTDIDAESNYVDTHGASMVGFAFTELLGFRLLLRLKTIGAL